MKVVLDSWAVIAFLRDEPAAEQVETAIEAGAVCSWINLAEVLYIETRRVGHELAHQAVDSVEGALTAELPDPTLFRAAARVKAIGGVSFADSFAIATAELRDSELLTGDPEILGCNRPSLKVTDLRKT